MKNRAKLQIKYPILLSTRVDAETRRELDDIAFFERTKVGTWLRELVVEAVKRYERNPQYLRHKRDMKQKEEKEKSR